MSVVYWIILAIVVIAVLWAVGVYNRFRRLKVMIQESWSGIDVQLKRKANIIPNLVDTIRMQMKFETDVLTRLTQMRSGLVSSDKAEAMKANDAINQLMPSIRATAESYPELGTNKSFLQMLEDIRDCEDKVAYARNRYNVTVANYNMSIVTFPANLISGMMRLNSEPMFEIAADARKDADDMRISKIQP